MRKNNSIKITIILFCLLLSTQISFAQIDLEFIEEFDIESIKPEWKVDKKVENDSYQKTGNNEQKTKNESIEESLTVDKAETKKPKSKPKETKTAEKSKPKIPSIPKTKPVKDVESKRAMKPKKTAKNKEKDTIKDKAKKQLKKYDTNFTRIKLSGRKMTVAEARVTYEKGKKEFMKTKRAFEICQYDFKQGHKKRQEMSTKNYQNMRDSYQQCRQDFDDSKTQYLAFKELYEQTLLMSEKN